jgi:hypothetical protein
MSERSRFEFWNILAETRKNTIYDIKGRSYRIPNRKVARYRERKNDDGTRSGSFELSYSEAMALGLPC